PVPARGRELTRGEWPARRSTHGGQPPRVLSAAPRRTVHSLNGPPGPRPLECCQEQPDERSGRDSDEPMPFPGSAVGPALTAAIDIPLPAVVIVSRDPSTQPPVRRGAAVSVDRVPRGRKVRDRRVEVPSFACGFMTGGV
ncbi:MAG: hypothetical protein ACYCT1_07515, partial [Steroidobacteraceae bacterium]